MAALAATASWLAATAVAPPSAAGPKLLGAPLRSDFPVLHQTVWDDKKLVYLDSAATSQKPLAVLQAMEQHQRRDNANVHRGAHLLSVRSTEAYEGARDKVAGFVNAASRSEIIFTRGATEAINLVAQTWGRANLQEGDEVVLSVMEHHSNLVPWQMLAQERGIILKFATLSEMQRRARAAHATHRSATAARPRGYLLRAAPRTRRPVRALPASQLRKRPSTWRSCALFSRTGRSSSRWRTCPTRWAVSTRLPRFLRPRMPLALLC